MNIERINELAKKSRNGGLTKEEKEEQAELREAYIKGFRESLISELAVTYIVDDKGNKNKLKRKDSE